MTNTEGIWPVRKGAKRNKQDARELATSISTLTDATLRPLEHLKRDCVGDGLQKSVAQFHECVLGDWEGHLS